MVSSQFLKPCFRGNKTKQKEKKKKKRVKSEKPNSEQKEKNPEIEINLIRVLPVMKSRVLQEKSLLFFPGYGLWIYGFPKMTIGSVSLSLGSVWRRKQWSGLGWFFIYELSVWFIQKKINK